MIDVSTATAIAIPVIGGIVWAVRLEGHVTAHDGLFVEREKQTNTANADIKNRLERIEDKLDRLTAR